MDKNVNVIPRQKADQAKIPVAVYCRVSTKSERQEDSLENQIEHYQHAVGEDPRYELTEIYYDFGISGFKAARPGFQRMMEDAEAGKFRLVITKAITRFARNTQTVLDSTRRLKELGIGVYFELQGINTLSQEGELLMTLFAAYGQAESEGARLHSQMAVKRRYEEGRPYRRLEKSMGYRKGADGEFYPNEYAPLVVEMYEMAADGYGAAQITNYLNSEGRTTHNGAPFNRASVARMLRSVVYKGDFIAQKHYVNDERRLVKNSGEKPMYYIEDDHIPLVSRELWDKAQATLDNATKKVEPTRAKALPLTDENYPYRHKLFCGVCGNRLIRAVRAGRVLWECSGKTRWTRKFCPGVCVTDDEVREWTINEPVCVSEITEKGVVKGHSFVTEAEWSRTHTVKKHVTTAPALNEENYPYMNRVFCKYCGSSLRRIINNNGAVTWICNGLSRDGKKACKGIRVPDAKLKPLAVLPGNFYIGKEKVHGKESYGYSRKQDGTR